MAGSAIKLILTGATGMVGEGVLLVCLDHPAIQEILVINRKPCGIRHPKLKELIHPDFYDLSPIESQLAGYNACFFCLGISSVGVKKDAYYKTTYTLTMQVARTLQRHQPGMTFCYVSGAGTSDKSRQSWAKVKAQTERDLAALFPGTAYGLRPGFIKPVPQQKQVHAFYRYVRWLFPIGRKLYPAGFCTMQELALCMIHLAESGYPQTILDGKAIIRKAAGA